MTFMSNIENFSKRFVYFNVKIKEIIEEIYTNICYIMVEP